MPVLVPRAVSACPPHPSRHLGSLRRAPGVGPADRRWKRAGSCVRLLPSCCPASVPGRPAGWKAEQVAWPAGRVTAPPVPGPALTGTATAPGSLGAGGAHILRPCSPGYGLRGVTLLTPHPDPREEGKAPLVTARCKVSSAFSWGRKKVVLIFSAMEPSGSVSHDPEVLRV